MQKNNHKFKLSLLSALIFLFSCAPGKTDQQVKIHVYCDSCFLNIANFSKLGENKYTEPIFEGAIAGTKFIDVYRLVSDYPCIRLYEFYSYNTDTAHIYFMENGDTTYQEHRITNQSYGYCH